MVCERPIEIQGERSRRHESRAYILVEEARLRCEALRAAAGTEASRAELHRLHRDLGLSALHVSTYIPPAHRRALLARVHARCDQRGRATRRGFERTVRRAERLLARATSRNPRAEHLELAGMHLLRAMEFLTPAPSPRLHGVHAFHLRHSA